MDTEPRDRANQLSKKDSEILRNTLRRLRVERSIQYVDLAPQLTCDVQYIYDITGRRRKGSQEFFSRVMNYCRSKRIEFTNIEHTSRLEIMLERLEIDAKVMRESIEYAGKYKLFSFISKDSIGVTWVELDRRPKAFPIAQFRTWRPAGGSKPIVVGGLYYGIDNSLFMAGNRIGTPFSRFVVTSSLEDSEYRSGFISGASSAEYMFNSFCIMKKVDDNRTKKISRQELGDFSWKMFSKRYPDEVGIMEENKMSFYAHKKPGQ